MARRVPRARALAYLALAAADGLPVPRTINFHKQDHVSLDLDAVGDFEQWARFLAVPDSTVHAKDDPGFRYRSGYTREWHGWPVHISCDEKTSTGAVPPQVRRALAEFVDSDASPEVSTQPNQDKD